jgi:hypothetical protein
MMSNYVMGWWGWLVTALGAVIAIVTLLDMVLSVFSPGPERAHQHRNPAGYLPLHGFAV